MSRAHPILTVRLLDHVESKPFSKWKVAELSSIIQLSSDTCDVFRGSSKELVLRLIRRLRMQCPIIYSISDHKTSRVAMLPNELAFQDGHWVWDDLNDIHFHGHSNPFEYFYSHVAHQPNLIQIQPSSLIISQLQQTIKTLEQKLRDQADHQRKLVHTTVHSTGAWSMSERVRNRQEEKMAACQDRINSLEKDLSQAQRQLLRESVSS